MITETDIEKLFDKNLIPSHDFFKKEKEKKNSEQSRTKRELPQLDKRYL